MLTRAAAAAATVLPVNIFLCGAPGATLHYQHLIWAAQYKYHVSHQVKDLYWPKNVSFLHAKKRFLWLSRICYCATYCVVGFTVNNGKLMHLVHTNKHSNFLMFRCSNVHLIFMCKNKISIHTHGFYLFRQTLPHHITTYLFLFIHNLNYFSTHFRFYELFLRMGVCVYYQHFLADKCASYFIIQIQNLSVTLDFVIL